MGNTLTLSFGGTANQAVAHQRTQIKVWLLSLGDTINQAAVHRSSDLGHGCEVSEVP